MRFNPITASKAIVFPLLSLLVISSAACHLGAEADPPATSASAPLIRGPRRTSAPPSTPTTGPGASATPAGPSGRIVFTCQIFAESQRNQLCTVGAAGQQLQRLTRDDGADHFYPSWTPDGQGIVFSSNLSGGYEIFEMALDGSPRQLTQHGRAYAPAISPDGERLIYTVRAGERADLWIAARDGSGPRWIAGEAWDAVWSPDGEWILHASDRGGSIQLWVVRPDGSGLRQVTALDGLRGRSDWSPDGHRLATYAGTAWAREIVTFAADGGDVRLLTEGGNNLAPSFSPGGDWLVFTSYRDNYGDENGCEIYIMRLDGSDIRRLTDNQHCDWQPRWGP